MRTIAQQLGVLQARVDRFDALSNRLKAEGTIIDVSGTDLEGEEGIPDGRGGPEELPPLATIPSMEVIRQQVTGLTDKADTAEIALETSLALAIRSSLGTTSGGGIPYLWPVITDTYRLSSPFGWRSDPFRKFRKWHGGMDIADKMQSPIIAAADGVVTFVGWRMGYGNLVEIKHENGFTTRYGHLTRGVVKEGQRVNAGDLVALMGSTGRSTGSHLHFEIRKDDNVLNPLAFIKDTREEVLQQAKSGRGRELMSEYRKQNKAASK
jgi:murein DD-endopeptidase MepM/ murein hydrolase activator NlpD